MKGVLIAFLIVPMASFALAQDADSNPFGNPDRALTAEVDWPRLHPDGKTPAERMLTLAHTDALPKFDRVELFAVSFPDGSADDDAKDASEDPFFPVHPYASQARVHGHVTLRGDDCDELRSAWQSLAFASDVMALCHIPVYGLRFYRDDQLLYETTICWKCQNFSLPAYDPNAQRRDHRWYGFLKDDKSEHLFQLLQAHLKHPKL